MRLFLFFFFSICSSEFLWKIETQLKPESFLPNPNSPINLQVNFEVLSEIRSFSSNLVDLELPQEVLTCNLTLDPILAPNLRKQFPSFQTFQGRCSDSRYIYLTFDQSLNTSLSVTLTDPHMPGDWLMIDFVRKSYLLRPFSQSDGQQSDLIVPACRSHAESSQVLPFGDEWFPTITGEDVVHTGGRLRLAVVTSRQFSMRYGDTLESVMRVLVSLISRVSAVFNHELSVTFQLIENVPRLWCVDGQISNCFRISDTDELSTIKTARKFIAMRGVSVAEFDIGHVFTINPGGVTSPSVVCDPDLKARGTSGDSPYFLVRCKNAGFAII